jgi:crossover junction endodeoxyribonuclease RuvC
MEQILGIDPGLSGGLCLLKQHHKILSSGDIETQTFPKIGSEPDWQKLAEVFRGFEGSTFAVLEKVSAMPRQGVASMFKFGRAYGGVQAMLHAFKIPYVEVTPQTWQGQIFQGVPAIYKTSSKGKTRKKDTKKMAALMASKLFPHVETRHDGMIDALLIAEWGRRELLKKMQDAS